MNTVAILAVILGPAVGALGVIFGWLQSNGERMHSLALAQAQQEHTLALTEGQQAHEHRLPEAATVSLRSAAMSTCGFFASLTGNYSESNGQTP